MEQAIKRLAEESAQWNRDAPSGFSAKPRVFTNGEIDYLEWDCCIPGENGTPWEGGKYKMRMSFSDFYPLVPPTVTFSTRMLHPNISTKGQLSMPMLVERCSWNPQYNVLHVLTSIQKLLAQPDLSNPSMLEPKAYNLFRSNPDEYHRKAASFAKKHSR